MEELKIAIIGQSNFAAEVLGRLLEESFKVVGVFTIQDQGSREDVLATQAKKHGIPVFKIKAWRKAGVALPEVLEQYKSVKANLNLLPYCSQFIPMEVIDGAKYGSICYHPSILPRHRGASAISWTLIEGDDTAGFTIFWADDGLDTGPILLQRQCPVLPTDTLDSLYKRFLYPEGIKYMVKAVQMVSNGSAVKIAQTEVGATYDAPMFKVANQRVNFNQKAKQIWNFIRGLDSSPGALAYYEEEGGHQTEIRLYNSHLFFGSHIAGREIKLKGLPFPAIVSDEGLFVQGTDDKYVLIKNLKKDGKMIAASDFFLDNKQSVALELTEEELYKKDTLSEIWHSILKIAVSDDTDFFASGAQSMDVVRLIEECNDTFGVALKNEQIYAAPIFKEFSEELIRACRGGGGQYDQEVSFDSFILEANKRKIPVPTQMFINGQFTNAEDGKTSDIINPTTNKVLCKVAAASKKDVDSAVLAAHNAFYNTWSKVTPKERGRLMFKLADLMEAHKEELATIEAVDSGAVYTLALKTHVGMSINAWRYFAGWTDKIEGKTIPIEPPVPNNVLTYTKREPMGVCALVVPWNYPLMMLSWKMSACIAAGNTCVIKPAMVCPLTALKFAELTVKAGFPPGVINVVTGSGSLVGQTLSDHPLVRKLGFTGSTEVGKQIMKSCASSNLKKCSLELGGKSPLVIFADCDLNKAVKQGASAVFFNKGENCIAAGRLFVEDTIHDEFVRRVVKDIKSMVIGDPLNRSTTHGPQNNRAHLKKLVEFCDQGFQEGANLVCGGKIVPGTKGLFFEPTVFTNVEDHMLVAQEESFGPIMLISKFNSSDVDSLIKRANASEFGLASGVFTNDINKALNFANRIEAGTVFVNVYNKTDVAAPFGGFKQSGFGKDLGQEALNEYLKTKCVTIEYS